MTIPTTVISPKKLIEVALPLDAINDASIRESYIYRGNPSAMHKWWAQRPLAAARAVIFAQLVHDPEDLWRCQNPGQEPNQQVRGHWTKARARLFKIIEDLVVWENTTNEAVLIPAREAIRQSWSETCDLNKDHPRAEELFDPAKLPGLHDPFAGGGTIPLEAQRLGLEAFASDLNPVAVLINKAMIEIPPKFAGKPPVHPDATNPLLTWSGTAGLAEDVRRYGAWMRDEAHKRIGHLYPQIEVTNAMVKDRPDLKPFEGEYLTVLAWLWARTVCSPNPAFSHIQVPLASTFIVSSKEGKESYVQPVIGKAGYAFTVKVGKPTAEAKAGTKSARGNFQCLMSKTPIDSDYLRTEAKAGRMGQRLMAIVAAGARGRVYLAPATEHETIINSAVPLWKPEVEFFQQALGFRVGNYGMTKWSDLFTDRQLVALTTFSDLVGEVRERIQVHGVAAGLTEDDRGIDDGGIGAKSYAEATSVYLAFAVDKTIEYGCTIVPWYSKEDRPKGLFARQAIPMVWDFAEVNPFAEIGGTFEGSVKVVAGTLGGCHARGNVGKTKQADAVATESDANCYFISTDPPYYDNVGYADLSDFFYVWLRRSLRPVYPDLLTTISVPKSEELVATPFRHGTKQNAEKFFLDGMTRAMHNLSLHAHPAAPITIYYAFKQSETEKEGTNSTGWETFLEGVLKSGLVITGTWPMRTERQGRMRDTGSNALASSIVLVCRSRVQESGTITRRQFGRMLNEALPLAIDAMTRESEGLHSPVAPVDLSQAIIGPGMAIFSRYDAVLEADGTPMTVRTALQLINRFLAEDDFDADTQFCLHWFEHYGWETGKFGEADTLARAKGTSVAGIQQAGVVESGGGNVRLLKWKEYPADWDPAEDVRVPVWEALHQLIRAYNAEGDSGAAKVLAGVAAKAEAARQLAYRLYTLCERANRAEDARAYNEVVTGWSGIESSAAKVATPQQRTLFDLEGAG
jgi:putative DNA methylase